MRKLPDQKWHNFGARPGQTNYKNFASAEGASGENLDIFLDFYAKSIPISGFVSPNSYV